MTALGPYGDTGEVRVHVVNAIPLSGAVTIAEPVTVDGTVAISGTVPVSIAAAITISGTVPVSIAATVAVADAAAAVLIGAVTETAPASDTASSGLNGRLQRIAQRITTLLSILPASLGAKASADAFATVTATDDVMIGSRTETAPGSDIASSGLNGRLQRIAQRLTSLLTIFPSTLGATTAAGSLSVTIATDDPRIGPVAETAPVSDTASSGLNGRVQRIAQRLTSLIALLPSALGSNVMTNSLSITIASNDAVIGPEASVAPGSDTGTSGLNGRLQRIAQRLTSLIAQVPAALGATTMASSMSVTIATDDARIGIVAETAPASDTASSGLNGRLQRIAQRITSLIALVPTSLGVKVSTGSFAIVTASDDAIHGIVTETAPASDTASSGLNGRLQRIAQRLTSLIALVPTALGAGGGLKTQLVSNEGVPLSYESTTTIFRLLTAAGTTNSSGVKNAAGSYFWIRGRNVRTSSVFIKVYNKSTPPTVGTDIPIDTIEVVASSTFIFDFPEGVYCPDGIGVGMTTAIADNDTGALTAGDITAFSMGYA